MRRRRALLMAVLCLPCAGCAAFMPNTAEAIAPATFEDVWVGVSADVESWVAFLSMFLGI